MTIEQDCSEDLQTECFPYMAKSIFTKRLHALYKDAHIRSGIHTALHCGYYILLFLSDIPRLKGWNAGHMTSSVETKEGRVNNFIHASIIVIYYCFYIALLMNCIAWEGINKLYHFVSHPRYLKSCIVYRWCGLTYAGGVLSWPFSIHLAGPESTTLKHEPSVTDKHSSGSQSSSSQSDETIFWRIQSATVHN